jgi:putative SOS response-associated peptidase YedK
MCGRFVGFRNLEELKQYFPIDTSQCETMENYNVAPTQQIFAIAKIEGSNVLDKYHWGLVPFWAKDTTIGYKMINARAETVATKPELPGGIQKAPLSDPCRCVLLMVGTEKRKTTDAHHPARSITLRIRRALRDLAW